MAYLLFQLVWQRCGSTDSMLLLSESNLTWFVKSQVEVKLGIFAKQAHNWNSVMLLSKQVLPFWRLNVVSHLDAKTCSVFSLVYVKNRLD